MGELELLLRVGEVADIDPILDYWYGLDEAVLRRMGIAPERMPSRESFRQLYLRMVDGDPGAEGFFFVVVGPRGERWGYSLFNHLDRPNHCHAHGHIFEATRRGFGVARAALIPILRAAFALGGVGTIVAEPKASNLAPNRLLQSHGFHPVRTYDKPAVGIVGAMRVNRYEVLAASLPDDRGPSSLAP